MVVNSPFIGCVGKNIRIGFEFILLGIFIFAISSLLIAFSTNVSNLFLGNIFLGLGCIIYQLIGLGVASNFISGKICIKAILANHASGVIGTSVDSLRTLCLSAFFLLEDQFLL